MLRETPHTSPYPARWDRHPLAFGIERRKIFNDDTARENFVELLSALLPETQIQCCAWPFLSDHAHFLLRSGSVS